MCVRHEDTDEMAEEANVEYKQRSTTAWTTNESIVQFFLSRWNSMIQFVNLVCICTFSNRHISFILKPNKQTKWPYLPDAQCLQFLLKRKKKFFCVLAFLHGGKAKQVNTS